MDRDSSFCCGVSCGTIGDRSARFGTVAAFFAVLASGCLQPWNTELPTVHARQPEVERAAAEVHDPFPDPELGPDTGFRPLAFGQPRTETRESQERLIRRNLQQQFGPPPAGALPPETRRPYPQVVR